MAIDDDLTKADLPTFIRLDMSWHVARKERRCSEGNHVIKPRQSYLKQVATINGEFEATLVCDDCLHTYV